jgi:formylmethanofuran:tetrahydromethanopterin formyltransferase
VATNGRAEVEDTYAEAFRSIYAEFLITARDRIWLDHGRHRQCLEHDPV